MESPLTTKGTKFDSLKSRAIRAMNFMKRHFPIRVQWMHVFENEIDAYVAFDKADAILAEIELCQIDLEDIELRTRVSDFALITINDPEAEKIGDIDQVPLFAKVLWDDRLGWRVTAPAWCWVLSNGRGLLWSINY